MADSAALAIRDRLDGRATKPKSKRALAKADEAILKEARERWARCDEAEDEQRKAILAAKKFRAGDQWPEAIKIQRQGSQGIAGVAAQPPRPCLTIDRLSQPCRQISNSIKSANFGFDVLPNGFGADTDTADIFKGYLRRVQAQARAEGPIEWAADQAIEGGIGWFRIRTDYAVESPDQPGEENFDQELRLERIANNLTVYCDPAASKPTRSDALFDFVTEDLSKDEFKTRWPKADVQGIEDFCATGDMKGWADQDNIRIAEYWRVTYADEYWIKTPQGVQKVSSFPEGMNPREGRIVRRPKVEGFKITATEILERWDWIGSRIPLIPILGEELNVDGKTIVRGVIAEGMDAQRMINYTYSGAVEIFALGPKSPFIVEEEQLGDYQQIWQTANTFNYSYLPYKHRPDVAPPHRETAEAPIQAAVELMRVSEEAVKATTGIYDPGLGNNNPREKSGRAIQALQGQSDLTSSNYPQNVKRALIYAGELMVEIIPKITRPGQLLQILGMDDEPEQVIIGQPYQEHPQTGQPIPAGQPGQKPDPEMEDFKKGLIKFYDLNAGRYAVTVDVSKAESTKREEGAAALADLIPHLPPEMAMVATPDYVANLSFPGSHKIAEKLRKALPPALQDQDEQGGEDPRIQQLQQQLMQMQQILESKVAEKQAEAQAKGQMDLQKTMAAEQAETQRTAAKLQVEERGRALDNLVKLAIAEISAKAAESKTDAEQARTELGFHQAHQDRTHEAIQNELDRQHERELTTQDHAVQATEAERDRQVQTSESAQDREVAKQQAKQKSE